MGAIPMRNDDWGLVVDLHSMIKTAADALMCLADNDPACIKNRRLHIDCALEKLVRRDFKLLAAHRRRRLKNKKEDA